MRRLFIDFLVLMQLSYGVKSRKEMPGEYHTKCVVSSFYVE
jgi:hypothetical protein